jgi:hypothetical protein
MENFFRNRKEVEDFFKNEYFVFTFFSEGTIYFETLRPIFLGNELFKFQLCFYMPENGASDFFNYSSFNDWLDKFQLSSVIKVDEIDNSTEELYLEKYNEKWS